jgi:hypothetical protein
LLVENARFYGAFLAWLTTIVGIIYGATGPDLFVSGFANAAFPHYVVNSVVGLAGTIAKTSLLGAVIENDPFMQSCA